MPIEWWRDLVIVINGFIFFVVLIAAGIIILLLYGKVSPILESVRSMSQTMNEMLTDVAEIARPFLIIGTIFKSFRGAFKKHKKGE
jgi:hypothetical protein